MSAMGERAWSRYNPIDLAAYVTRQAGNGIMLALDRKANEQSPAGRRAIVEALYNAVLEKGLRYVSETYHPSDALQRIRSAEEIFAGHEGTCLDLAVLFCGICLHFDLLPYLIVFEDHAIAAVATTDGLSNWNATRPGRALFDDGPLTETAEIRSLLQNDLLIAVECTGFARSEYLSRSPMSSFPETVGREDGVMSFARSVAAGVDQFQSGRRLRFAVDIAVAHFAWRISPRISRGLRGESLQDAVRDFFDFYLGSTTDPAPFGGRSDEMRALDDWLASDRPFALVLAPAGRGKSALLVHWVTRTRAVKPGPEVVFFPISVRHQTNQEQNALRTIASFLAACHGELAPESREIDELRASIRGYLRRPLSGGRTLILVLDGLDEAANWVVDRTLFPAVRPKSLKILLATRPLAGDLDNQELLALLGVLRTQSTFLPLRALTFEGIIEVLDLAAPILSAGEKSALARRLLELTEGDPLLLRLYRDELDLGRSSPGEALSRLRGLDVGIPGYMKLWCDEQTLLRGINPLQDKASRVLLELCAHALGPLSTADIVALGGQPLVSSAAVQQAVRLVDRLLIGDGNVTGFVFSHPRLAEYVRGLSTSAERSVWERSFLEYGRSTLAGLDASRLSPSDVSTYLLRYFSAHLRRDAPAELELLLSLSWLRAWEESSGAVSGFLDDLNLAWDDGASRGEAGLLTQVKAALYSSSLSSTVRQVPAVILEAALRNQLISPIKALSLARRHASMGYRCHCLAVVVPFLLSEEQRDDAWKEWLELLPRVPTRDGERTSCLRYHLDKIPAKFIPQLVEVVQRTEDRSSRIGMLSFLLKRLTGEELQQCIEQILEQIEAPPRMGDAYQELIPVFPAEQRAPLMAGAVAYITSKEVALWNRARRLCRLGFLVEGAERKRMLTMARKAARDEKLSERDRARSLLEIFPLLPGPPRKTDQDRFIHMHSALDDNERNGYFRALSDKLSQSVVAENWFYFALAMDLEPDTRAALALRLPEPDRSKYFRESWNSVRAQGNRKGIKPLAFLFARAPQEWKNTLREELMDFVRANVAVLAPDCEETIFDLYQHFPEEIYRMVSGQVGSSLSASWVCLVAQRFRPDHEAGLVRLAWEQSRVVSDGVGIAKLMAALLPRLSETERVRVVQFVLSGSHAHSMEDAVLPVLRAAGPAAALTWLMEEPAATRGDVAMKIASWQPEEIRVQLELACIARSPFRDAGKPAAAGYGIDATVAVTAKVLVEHISESFVPGLLKALMATENEHDEIATLHMIRALAARLSAAQADDLAEWVRDDWHTDGRLKFWSLASLLPSLSADQRETIAELLLRSAELASTEWSFILNSLLGSLVAEIPSKLMPHLLELMNTSESPMDRAELLHRVGERLSADMVPRFTQRCEELLSLSVVTMVEGRSAMARYMPKEEKDAFVNQHRAEIMAVDHGPDRVRTTHYLSAFCDAETARELWETVMTTEKMETDYLSSSELGLSISPRMMFYAAVAKWAPSWLLLRCLEAGAAAADFFHSDDVVNAVLLRWPEVRALGRAEELRAFSLLLRHGAARGRIVLTGNLLEAGQSIPDERISGFLATLEVITQIRN